jgi:hypothetical protein
MAGMIITQVCSEMTAELLYFSITNIGIEDLFENG